MDRISGIESIPEIQAEFLVLFPRIQERAYRYARFLRRREDREDLAGAIIAETWRRYRAGKLAGKPVERFAFVREREAFVAVLRCNVYTADWKQDEPLSAKNRLNGRSPVSLETECGESDSGARLLDQLAGREDDPADLAQASLDWQAWYASLTQRERDHIDALASGAGVHALRAGMRLSRSGERKARRQLATSWAARQGIDPGRPGRREG